MGRKKIRVTNELIQRLEKDGVPGLSRQECRVLERKGYITQRYAKADDGSVRLQYKIVRNLLIKEE